MRALGLALALALVVAAVDARAEPPPRAVIEPHLAFAPFGPPGARGQGIGAGLRAVVVLLPDGLSPKLTDTLSLSFGADVVRYVLAGRIGTRCRRFETAVDGETRICVESDAVAGGPETIVHIPVAAEWSVQVAQPVSVQAELGLALRVRSGLGVGPAIGIGTRWRFAEGWTLAVRVGYPVWTVGLAWAF